MPDNPERATRGGDISGTTKTDPEHGLGDATTVAKASYDGGYGDGIQEDSMPDTTMADLKQGYCSYGVSTGEKRGKGYVGGS